MKEFEHTLMNPEGIHARPAGQLVKRAQAYASAITLGKNGQQADLKRLFAVMALAAKQGETVTVRAAGPDEEQAIAGLEEYMRANM